MRSVRLHVWRPINRPHFGSADVISERIRTQEWRQPDLLTAVNRGPTLLVVSDYAGDHRDSRFHSFSFLLADLAFLWYWDEVRSNLRRHMLSDGRRLTYKKLQSDNRRARVLVPFLRAANSIPGLLMTFLIDKRIESLFKPDPEFVPSVEPVVPPEHWRDKPFEKLLRVAHLGALLVSGLVGDGQNLLWISDQDEIVPNDERHVEACKLLGHVLGHYLNCDVGRLGFATTRSDDGSFLLEDIAALPDFAAGALAEVATSMARSGALSANEVLTPMDRGLPEKARALTGWLADSSYALKKLAFVIDYVPPDRFQSKFLILGLDEAVPEYNYVPDLMRCLQGVPGQLAPGPMDKRSLPVSSPWTPHPRSVRPGRTL